MKFPIAKSLFILSCVTVLSFSIAYAAFEIATQKKIQEKIDTFKRGGIRVTFEDREIFVQPINLDTFADDVDLVGLGVPVQGKQSATLAYEKGKYVVQAEKPGLSLNRDMLMSDVKGRIRTFSTVPVIVQVKVEAPEISKDELEKALPVLTKKFNTALSFTSKDFNLSLKFKDHLDWLMFRKTLDPATGVTSIVPDIQGAPFESFIREDWGKKVNREPTTVKIAKDEKGKIVFDGHGKNGLSLDMNKLVTLLRGVLVGSDATVKFELPIDEKEFALDVSVDLQALGIKEVVAIGHTSYYGSPQNRMYNINIGVDKFNGVMIAKDEVFSFNTLLGPVDGAHGFLKELVIKPEGTVPEFGGGLCQVSTTAYRGALYGGLPIVERSPHSYAVTYYSQIGGHGIDATIYPGVHDLRFKNDTPAPLLLQAYTEGSEAYFIYYGTSDHREVKLEGPVTSNRNSIPGTDVVETTDLAPGQKKQVERAHVGFSTLWYRYITLPGGLTQKEAIASTYRATKDKILLGVAKPDAAVPVPGGEKGFVD